uniref:Putative tnf receptor-associated factor 5 n=1 Tax=Ixodes ricinus TaxID=34613 RepID=V5HRY0_IXORI
MASFRVAEFSEVLDWRPMLFQEPIIAQRACVLCGVVYKKAVRLPCVHTLCTKCHSQCVERGSACPVDQKPFCEDDVEQLDVSLKYLLNRAVACWNAPKGCSFIGTAASLLDHYKECGFSIVPCCLCRSSVLQSDILEHFKTGCSIHEAKYAPTDNLATKDIKDVSSTCLKRKKATRKISEDLMSLQTSLNRCSEDVRAESARCKDQSEAQASKLAEQLNTLNTVYTTGFAKELQVLQAAMADYKDHVTKELRLLGRYKPRRVHWYIEGWADLKKKALKGELQQLNSPTRSIYDLQYLPTCGARTKQ